MAETSQEQSPAAVQGTTPSSAIADGELTEPVDPSVVPRINVGSDWTVEAAASARLHKMAAAPEGGSALSSYGKFIHLLEGLKLTKRQGWTKNGIKKGESVADHMYRMAVMAMFLPQSLAGRIDSVKCMKMCLIHDIAETLVGDITPVDGVLRETKAKREISAMEYISRLLPGLQSEELLGLWHEFESGMTPEAKVAQDLDKLELLYQMVEYQSRGTQDLSEFRYVATKLQLPETQDIAASLLKQHEECMGGGGVTVAANADSELRKMQDEYYGTGAD